MFEALMGAIYLESDRNFTVARDWFHQECGGLLNF
jgi:dsRNA-specific ribonuclease